MWGAILGVKLLLTLKLLLLYQVKLIYLPVMLQQPSQEFILAKQGGVFSAGLECHGWQGRGLYLRSNMESLVPISRIYTPKVF